MDKNLAWHFCFFECKRPALFYTLAHTRARSSAGMLSDIGITDTAQKRREQPH